MFLTRLLCAARAFTAPSRHDDGELTCYVERNSLLRAPRDVAMQQVFERLWMRAIAAYERRDGRLYDAHDIVVCCFVTEEPMSHARASIDG